MKRRAVEPAAARVRRVVVHVLPQLKQALQLLLRAGRCCIEPQLGSPLLELRENLTLLLPPGFLGIGQQKGGTRNRVHPILSTHLIIAFLLGQVESSLARHILGCQGAPRLAQ